MLTTASPASAAPAAAAYGLRPTPFSGLSLIASRPLNPGTLVLADKPLFVLPQTVKDPEELYARVRALGPDGVRTYLGLANSKGKERDVTPLMGIFKTNVLPAGPNESGIFPVASRLNHSCTPSAEASYASPSSTLSVRALREHAAGDEVTISYLGARLLQPAADRQAWLLSSFGFLCECEACTVDFARADAVRQRAAELKATIDDCFASDPEGGYRASVALLEATAEAGLVVEQAFALATLAQLLILWGAGGTALAEEYVSKTVDAMGLCRGEGDEWRRWVAWRGRTAEHPRNGTVGSFDFGGIDLTGPPPAALADA